VIKKKLILPPVGGVIGYFEKGVLALFVALVTMFRGGDFIDKVFLEFSPALFASCR